MYFVLGNVRHKFLGDETVHRYEYSGIEFDLDRCDVLPSLPHYPGLHRLEFFFQFTSFRRYISRNVNLRITFTLHENEGARRRQVNEVTTIPFFVNTTNAAGIDVSPGKNVACASISLTSWFNRMLEVFEMPMKVTVKVEKLCDPKDRSCRRVLLSDVFGVVFLHYCA